MNDIGLSPILLASPQNECFDRLSYEESWAREFDR